MTTDSARAPAPATRPHTRRRPHAVTFVAFLCGVEGLAAVALVAGLVSAWVQAPDEIQVTEIQSLMTEATLLGTAGVALLLSAVGLLLVRPWAWTLAMATQCLTLTITLFEYLSGDPDYLVMALGVLAVLLLNLQEVRLAFETEDGAHG